jgi:hypothetical protein
MDPVCAIIFRIESAVPLAMVVRVALWIRLSLTGWQAQAGRILSCSHPTFRQAAPDATCRVLRRDKSAWSKGLGSIWVWVVRSVTH